jgi:hypothetical protein
MNFRKYTLIYGIVSGSFLTLFSSSCGLKKDKSNQESTVDSGGSMIGFPRANACAVLPEFREEGLPFLSLGWFASKRISRVVWSEDGSSLLGLIESFEEQRHLNPLVEETVKRRFCYQPFVQDLVTGERTNYGPKYKDKINDMYYVKTEDTNIAIFETSEEDNFRHSAYYVHSRSFNGGNWLGRYDKLNGSYKVIPSRDGKTLVELRIDPRGDETRISGKWSRMNQGSIRSSEFNLTVKNDFRAIFDSNNDFYVVDSESGWKVGQEQDVTHISNLNELSLPAYNYGNSPINQDDQLAIPDPDNKGKIKITPATM